MNDNLDNEGETKMIIIERSQLIKCLRENVCLNKDKVVSSLEDHDLYYDCSPEELPLYIDRISGEFGSLIRAIERFNEAINSEYPIVVEVWK